MLVSAQEDCFTVFIDTYGHLLAAALASSKRLYDSGVGRTSHIKGFASVKWNWLIKGWKWLRLPWLTSQYHPITLHVSIFHRMG